VTTLVCPVCAARWKILLDGDGDRLAVCPVCNSTVTEDPVEVDATTDD
jgi:hypothetical protein